MRGLRCSDCIHWRPLEAAHSSQPFNYLTRKTQLVHIDVNGKGRSSIRFLPNSDKPKIYWDLETLMDELGW